MTRNELEQIKEILEKKSMLSNYSGFIRRFKQELGYQLGIDEAISIMSEFVEEGSKGGKSNDQ